MSIDARRILAYSCTHFPYQHEKTFSFLAGLKREYKPTVVVCLGDICDLHSLSKYPKHPECLGPADEIKQAKDCVKRLAALFPKQLVCKSNHDQRIERIAVQHGIPHDCIKKWEEIFRPPAGWLFGWEHEVGPAITTHGDRYMGKDGIRNAVADSFCCVIQGHIHTEHGVFWQERKGGKVWGAQSGCLIDPAYAAFEYEQKNRNRPLNGGIVVIDNVPQAIPMN